MRILLLLGVITWHVTRSVGLPSGLNCDVNTKTKPITSFSDESFKVIAGDASGNIVYSTFSLTMILSMITWGAGGNTLLQLQSALENPFESVPPRDPVSNEDGFEENEAVQLKTANKIFLAKGFTPKLNFLYMLKHFYHSTPESVNFGEAEKASKTINDWCANSTNNRITDLVQPGDFSSETALVLANAVYFKGNWINQFNKDETELRPFYVNETTVKQVPTMWKVDAYRYGEIPEVKAKFIELPYKTNEKTDPISMFIILPDEINGIKELIKNFEKVTTKKLHDGEKMDVKLLLPKFKIETTVDLEEPLAKLGLNDLFGHSADFTDISEERPLTISKIVQKTFIEVNEEGTEAASVTGSQLDSRMQRQAEVDFIVDRPFISLIATEFGVPIFTAVTVDPSSAF